MSEIDNVIPKEKWEFDDAVANCFENMLGRSIPQYDVMRNSVADLAYSIINRDGAKKESFTICDLGCSDDLMIQKFLDRFDRAGRYVGIDVSDPMLQKAKYRFLDDIIDRKIKIDYCDLRTDFPEGFFDVVSAVLSVQFTPIEYRQHIIQNVYDHLAGKDGCFIMVEKVLGATDTLNRLFVENYYRMKSDNGYSQEQIERKRLSLEGVLVPVTNDWNVALLKQAGFRQVDVFWRWMNFVGYIAIK